MRYKATIDETAWDDKTEEFYNIKETQIEKLKEETERADKILRQLTCYSHPRAMVHLMASWRNEVGLPHVHVITCCPVFTERIEKKLLKPGLDVTTSFLRSAQPPNQN